MKPIIIIGSGLAGYSLARELRKLDQTTPLVIITCDPGRMYSKPLLSNALTRFPDADQVATFTAAQMAEQLNAEIMTNTLVEKIVTDKKIIHTSEKEIAFDKLVLATGAHAIKPSLKGNAVNQILSVNNLVDYEMFRETLSNKKHVAIIGSGLIGCEFANDLLKTNHQVDVASFEPWPLHRFLPEKVGCLMQEKLAQCGVNWHMDNAVVAVDKKNDRFQLTLANDKKITAELVLSAIGIAPDLQLANDTKIKTNKGIIVDEHLETSTNDIFALGDCIEVGGLILPFVMPLMQCARVLAKTLTGDKTKLQYPCMPVVVKTPSYPVVVSPLVKEAEGEWQIEIDDSGAKALYTDKKNQLQAFALTDKKITQRMELAKQIQPWF